MKRFVSLLMACMLILSVGTCVLAEESETFLFRNIPWYAPKKEVSDTLSSLTMNLNLPNATIPDWFQTWEHTDSDYTVAKAGAGTGYGNVSVAGYNAELIVYYVYPIVDGKLLRNGDEAEFYLAVYEFSDSADMEAVYNDLVTKLTGLYGESSALNKWGRFTGRLWKAKDGSQIWLRIYNTNGDYTVQLSYTAPESTSRLEAVEAQITKEKLEAEELERQKNINNTDGL